MPISFTNRCRWSMQSGLYSDVSSRVWPRTDRAPYGSMWRPLRLTFLGGCPCLRRRGLDLGMNLWPLFVCVLLLFHMTSLAEMPTRLSVALVVQLGYCPCYSVCY